MLDGIRVHTSDILVLIEFFGSKSTIDELLATYIHHLVFEKSWYIVYDRIQKDRNYEITCFDVMLLDEKWHSDCQESFNCNGNGSVTWSSQTYLLKVRENCTYFWKNVLSRQQPC